jgi:DNA repair exonuclease SbcCD ATPase subunit
MNIEILSLTITAFRSINKRILIEFSDIPKGLVFVSGKNLVEPELAGNGAGKSTMMEAICWILFGKTSMNLKAGVIHNWDTDRKTRGMLTIKRNGIVHYIERGWDPNYLKLDKENVSQERLEQFLDVDFYSFLYSVFISQHGSKFFDLESSTKLKVFTSILRTSLEKWIKSSDKASELVKKYAVQTSDLRENVARTSGAISSIDIEALREKYDNFEERRKSDLRVIKSRLKEKHSQVERLEVKTEGTLHKSEKTSERLEELKNKLNVKIDEQVELRKQFNKTNEELAVSKNKIEEMKEEIENMNSLKDKSICYTCGGVISTGRIIGHISHMTDMLKGRLEERVATVTIRKKLHEKILEQDIVVGEFRNKIESINNEYNELLNSRRSDLREISSIMSNISSLEEELDINKDSTNPFLELIDEETEKLHDLREKRKKFKKELEKIGKLHDVTELCKKGFKEIRLMVLNESLTELEIQINNNLHLLGLVDWRIELDIESETKRGNINRELSVMIIPPNSNKKAGKVPLETWSGGERQRLILAGTLGLMDFVHNRRSTDWNIEWLDEPTQFLSEPGIESLMNIMRNRAKRLKKTIFFADHRNLDSEGKFSAIVNVVKNNSGTSIQSITS